MPAAVPEPMAAAAWAAGSLLADGLAALLGAARPVVELQIAAALAALVEVHAAAASMAEVLGARLPPAILAAAIVAAPHVAAARLAQVEMQSDAAAPSLVAASAAVSAAAAAVKDVASQRPPRHA